MIHIVEWIQKTVKPDIFCKKNDKSATQLRLKGDKPLKLKTLSIQINTNIGVF